MLRRPLIVYALRRIYRLGDCISSFRRNRSNSLKSLSMVEHYQDRKRRDERAKALRAEGQTVRVHTSRSIMLQPMYVNDWTRLVENDQWAWWPVLYRLEAKK